MNKIWVQEMRNQTAFQTVGNIVDLRWRRQTALSGSFMYIEIRILRRVIRRLCQYTKTCQYLFDNTPMSFLKIIWGMESNTWASNWVDIQRIHIHQDLQMCQHTTQITFDWLTHLLNYRNILMNINMKKNHSQFIKSATLQKRHC